MLAESTPAVNTQTEILHPVAPADLGVEIPAFFKTQTNTTEYQDLLSHLWRGGAWAYFWTPDGEEYWSEKYQEYRQSKPSIWFPVDARWPKIPTAWAERNVYFGVHPTTEARKRWQRSTIATIAAVNCVFAEFDVPKQFESKAAVLEHLDALLAGGLPYPTATIDSGGGIHAYWFFEHTVLIDDSNRDHWRRIQGAWVDLVGSDDGAKDLARVLRLPGYRNMKPEYAPEHPTVTILEFTPKRMFRHCDIVEPVQERIAELETVEQRRIEEDRARLDEAAPGAAPYLLDWAVNNAQTGSRHNMALWLAGRLKAEGIAQFAADSVVQEFGRRVNTHGERALDEKEMRAAVRYVYNGVGQ